MPCRDAWNVYNIHFFCKLILNATDWVYRYSFARRERKKKKKERHRVENINKSQILRGKKIVGCHTYTAQHSTHIQIVLKFFFSFARKIKKKLNSRYFVKSKWKWKKTETVNRNLYKFSFYVCKKRVQMYKNRTFGTAENCIFIFLFFVFCFCVCFIFIFEF